MKKIRAFIAVEIPDDLKQALAGVQRAFQGTRNRISWVRPAGMHITLKFLGDIEERKIPEIGREMEQVASGRGLIPVEFFGTGVFPDLNRPRVLWAGIRQGADPLGGIFEELDPRLAGIGFSGEPRPFRPHLTLGRIKQLRDRQGLATRVEENRDREIGSMTADSLHLMESRLRPEGALYTSRLTVPLEGAGV